MGPGGPFTWGPAATVAVTAADVVKPPASDGGYQ